MIGRACGSAPPAAGPATGSCRRSRPARPRRWIPRRSPMARRPLTRTTRHRPRRWTCRGKQSAWGTPGPGIRDGREGRRHAARPRLSPVVAQRLPSVLPGGCRLVAGAFRSRAMACRPSVLTRGPAAARGTGLAVGYSPEEESARIVQTARAAGTRVHACSSNRAGSLPEHPMQYRRLGFVRPAAFRAVVRRVGDVRRAGRPRDRARADRRGLGPRHQLLRQRRGLCQRRGRAGHGRRDRRPAPAARWLLRVEQGVLRLGAAIRARPRRACRAST